MPTVGNARPAVGKIRVGSVRWRFRGDRCQGYGICNGGMPEGVPRGRRMKVLINLQWCKGCGVCVAFCRSGALSLDGDGKPEYAPALCVGCGLCVEVCPRGLISNSHLTQEDAGRILKPANPVS